MDNKQLQEQIAQHLNVELLESYLETLGKGMLEKMFALYCQQVAIYLADIHKAICDDSASAWREHCHKMKGAAASVGLTYLHSRLVILEKVTASAPDKAELYSELSQDNDKAMAAFTRWLDSVS